MKEILSNADLLKSVDIDALDSDGWTPLMAAVYWQHSECVALLLQNNANADITAMNGLNCVSLANDNIKILELLETNKKQREANKQREIASDNTSDLQRRAHAKKVRETRRSTQGVKVEDVAAAITLTQKGGESKYYTLIARTTRRQCRQ